MDFLFGEGQGYGLRFLVAFVVVLGLIGLTAWLVRRFGSERLGTGGARGRQPRLAVIDAATVDGRRRLILIRRDNVEHLLMIGGPSDVVIEPNIVRSAMPRDSAPPRPSAAPDALPRAVPLGEGSMWPLQPEPAPVVPAPPPRVQRQAPPPPVVEESMQWHAEAEPPPPPPPPPAPARPARQLDPLAGLAAELARQPMPSVVAPRPPREREEPREPVREAPRQREPREREPREREPREREPMVARAPQLKAPAEPPPGASDAQFSASADQNLAEMAQRLEAALRRPPKVDVPPPEPKPEPRLESRPEPRLKAVAPAPPPPPPAPELVAEPIQPVAAAPEPETMMPAPVPMAAEPKPAREGKAAREPKGTPSKSSLYDSLEQEMASLLGRPGKS